MPYTLILKKKQSSYKPCLHKIELTTVNFNMVKIIFKHDKKDTACFKWNGHNVIQ